MNSLRLFRIFPPVAGVWALFACVAESASDPEWKVVKGTHFLVLYQKDADLAERISRKAEECYTGIAVDLGIQKHGEFWLWEKRVKIYVYPDRHDFLKATRSPEWASGKAVWSRKEILTYPGNSRFLESVLPHEIAHLLFRDFMGFQDAVPLWLNEGIAQWEEKDIRSHKVRLSAQGVASGKIFPIKDLTQVDVAQLTDAGRAALFYAQSASLVGFLIETHGAEMFRKFCGQLRDGKKVEDALRFAYPQTIRNMDELEKGWKEYVRAKQEGPR